MECTLSHFFITKPYEYNNPYVYSLCECEINWRKKGWSSRNKKAKDEKEALDQWAGLEIEEREGERTASHCVGTPGTGRHTEKH